MQLGIYLRGRDPFNMPGVRLRMEQFQGPCRGKNTSMERCAWQYIAGWRYSDGDQGPQGQGSVIGAEGRH